MVNRRECLVWLGTVAGTGWLTVARASEFAQERHLLYVTTPGIRNDVQYGGIGILVFDIDNGHKLLRRIPTIEPQTGAAPEPVKGVCANAHSGYLYLSTTARLLCFDLRTDKLLWNKTYPGGCDRMAITPDGKQIYLPSLEGPHWHVIDGDGNVITKIVPNSGSHNTVCGLDGKFAYLAGLKSPLLTVVDTHTNMVARTVGPFSNVIRPFTVNRQQSLCFVNVNELLGFEIGDIRNGKKLYRVEVPGVQTGPVKRHGCPSHGIGLTPDEREIWVSDGHNSQIHVFDATQMPPKFLTTIPLRDQPGWVTFSLDGKYAYPSSGEVIDARTKQVITALTDETGRAVGSEKMVQIDFASDKPIRTGDQFGLGRNQHPKIKA